MRVVALITLLVGAACSFPHGREPEVDAGPDAPPTTTKVYFTSITTDVTTVRPGLYGIEVTAVLHNDLDTEITNVGTLLTFGGRGNQFRFRDADRREGVMTPQPTTVAAGSEASFVFVVDALATLTAADVSVNASATFLASGTALSAEPAASALALPYTGINAPIVVNTAVDEDNGNAQTSLREALEQASTAPGPDIIRFDATVLPTDSMITLDASLGALPAIVTDVVIDGGDVVLAVTSAWESPAGRYGLRVVGGTVVVSNLTFPDFAYAYPDEDIESPDENCGSSNAQLEGGAIRVDGGTLILDNNRFEDPDVAERNCYAASVRIHGGNGHQILRNRWSRLVMDAVYVGAATREITDNTMISPAATDRDDEGIYIATQAGSDLWIVGNLIVDQEYSGIYAGGSDGGKLYVINNTLARNGRVSLSGIRRGGNRTIVLRNNLYVANNPAAITANNSGTGFDLAFETVTGSPLCDGSCDSAMIDMSSMGMPADPGVANPAGSTRADFTPTATSALVGAGTPYLDRNGGSPGYFNGDGAERGAIELP